MELLDQIVSDPLKLGLSILLIALEFPAVTFLIGAWLWAKGKEKRDE